MMYTFKDNVPPSKSNSSKLNVQNKDPLPNCMKLLDKNFHHFHDASPQNNRCSNMQADWTLDL